MEIMTGGTRGLGLPAHGLGNLDVSRVLALPLYLYVEPWGLNLERKPPQGRFCPHKVGLARTERVQLGFQQYRVQAVVPLTSGSTA